MCQSVWSETSILTDVVSPVANFAATGEIVHFTGCSLTVAASPSCAPGFLLGCWSPHAATMVTVSRQIDIGFMGSALKYRAWSGDSGRKGTTADLAGDANSCNIPATPPSRRPIQ